MYWDFETKGGSLCDSSKQGGFTPKILGGCNKNWQAKKKRQYHYSPPYISTTASKKGYVSERCQIGMGTTLGGSGSISRAFKAIFKT